MLDVMKLEQHIQEQRDAAQVPGVALAIVSGEEILYANGFGLTSVEDGALRVTPQTLFRIASTTKPMTGTAAMRLVETGALDLDGSIRQYLPWLTLSNPESAERITLRHLLSHTAGLPSEYELTGSRDPTGLENYVRHQIPHLPLVAAPGEQWHYSNPSLNLVGHLLEAATGKTFAEVMQELIFAPLQMQRTTFDLTVAMTYPLAQSHEADSEGRLRVQHRFWDRVAGYPSGGALSTVLDLAHFAMLHLNAGKFAGTQLLSPTSIAQMHTRQTYTDASKTQSYGLTFFLDEFQGYRIVQHWGGVDSFSSRFVLVPEAHIAVILLHNRLASPFDSDGIITAILHRVLPESTTH
jgi:CubicO group peptidase (beta-lactamase class C family)